MKRIILLSLSLCLSTLNAQDWVEGMQDPSINFYQVQSAFNAFWQGKEIEKGKGWKQFKRWEHFTNERVYPEGIRPTPSILYSAQMQQAEQMQTSTPLGNWRPVGPFDGNAIGGIGRLNCVAFHPTNTQIIYVGAPAGGLWKSTNGGQTWSTSTDQLTNLGVSAIVIDPTNPNIMFISTGDRDAADTYSHGVMKSTDGGDTWLPTGMTHNLVQNVRATGLHMNPLNAQELVLTTRSGIFKTMDGGGSWINVQGGAFQSIIQKINDPNILFATTFGSARIWQSINAGDSWVQLPTSTGGLPSNARRIELAVTPANVNIIYALAAGNDNGFRGLYRSIDGGNTWVEQSSTPNLLGWSTNGSDSGGQGWYDLAIACSPTNADEIYCGGVNIWKSTNGGSTWNLNAHWFGGGGRPYVHADIHALAFQPGTNRLFSCSDGGLDITENGGNTWNSFQDGMNITQYYRIGTSPVDTLQIIAGAQDNGTHLRANFWDRVGGGDGMDCAIDPQNPQIMYSSIYYGDFYKSTNGGNTFTASFNLPPSGTGNWVTPLTLDPNNGSVVYAGFTGLWKSTNAGVSFTNVSGSINGTNIDRIYVPKVNSNHVYVGITNELYRSTNGGSSFSLFSNLPGSGTVTGIAVSDNDQNKIWVSRSGYAQGQKLYFSNNGGSTWTNISDNLPNVPANCVTFGDTNLNGIYVGTDIGVYYRDDLLSEWKPFMSGLPNVIVNELEIQPIANKIRACTYGRGVWESPLYDGQFQKPIADFTSPKAVCGIGDTIRLSNATINFPEDFRWYFIPNTVTYVNGTSDTSENPVLVLNSNGWYNVALFASNINGSDSLYRQAVFRVGGLIAPFFENFEPKDAFESWEIVNPDIIPELGWQGANRIGINGQGTKTAMMDLFAYSQNGLQGRRDHLISPPLDLSTLQNAFISFDHAYARRTGSSNDTLILSISTNCGNTWTTLRKWTGLGGPNSLATRANQSGVFNPTAATDWCGQAGFAPCNNIDLSVYDGLSNVKIRFTTVSRFGNRLYLDNIVVGGQAGSAPIADFVIDPQSCANYALVPQNLSGGIVDSVYWIFTGGVPLNSSQYSPQVTYPNAGSYNIELRVFNNLGNNAIIKNQIVQVQQNTPVQININSGAVCQGTPVNLSLTTQNEGVNPQFEWFINGQAAGQNVNQLSLNNLQNGDFIYAKVRSSEICAWPLDAYSDTLSISFLPAPTVSAAPMAAVCVSDSPILLTFGSPIGGSYSGPGIVNDTLFPNLAGSGVKILRYTFTDTNGCSASATRSVQVASKPVLSLGNTLVCRSSGIVPANWVVNPVGGNYYFNGLSISNLNAASLNPGTYTIEYSFTQSACDTLFSFDITVVDGPAQPSLVYSNDSLETANSSSDYRWFYNGFRITGAQNNFYIPTQNGYYQVEIRDSSGCGNRSDSVLVENIGLNESHANSEWSFFPNPNKGHFNIDLRPGSRAKLLVQNILGQTLTSFDIESGLTEIQIKLPKGVYFLVLERENTLSKKRLLIQ